MTPETLAALHAKAMQIPGPWSAQEFAQFLKAPGVFLVSETAGFALGRVTLDEGELLTLAVAPVHQRAGAGRRLLARFEDMAENHGATRVFLEVAATNLAAKALYVGAVWQVDGLRRGYYRAKPHPIDAALMSKALPNA